MLYANIDSWTQRIAVDMGSHSMKVARGSRIRAISSVFSKSHTVQSQSPKRLVRVSRRLLLQVPREGLWQSGFLDWLDWMRNYICICIYIYAYIINIYIYIYMHIYMILVYIYIHF